MLIIWCVRGGGRNTLFKVLLNFFFNANHNFNPFFIIIIPGALFISMPLAIIGNEYQFAWAEVSDRIKKEQDDKLELRRVREEVAMKKKFTVSMIEGVEPLSDEQLRQQEAVLDNKEVQASTLMEVNIYYSRNLTCFFKTVHFPYRPFLHNNVCFSFSFSFTSTSTSY